MHPLIHAQYVFLQIYEIVSNFKECYSLKFGYYAATNQQKAVIKLAIEFNNLGEEKVLK